MSQGLQEASVIGSEMPRKVLQATPYKQIGDRLRSMRLALARLEQGPKTLDAFAREAGLKPNAYSQNETGARMISVEAALKLKAAHGISLDWIYAGDDGTIPRRVLTEIAAIRKTL